jgi:hypothetical protein
MHSKLSIAEGLHTRAHVVFHEHAAVAATLVPVRGKPVTVLERRIHVVAMVHHESVTGAMQTVEQPELLARAAQPVARGDEYFLRERHSHSRVEVSLQNSMVTSGLIPIVALRQ